MIYPNTHLFNDQKHNTDPLQNNRDEISLQQVGWWEKKIKWLWLICILKHKWLQIQIEGCLAVVYNLLKFSLSANKPTHKNIPNGLPKILGKI